MSISFIEQLPYRYAFYSLLSDLVLIFFIVFLWPILVKFLKKINDYLEDAAYLLLYLGLKTVKPVLVLLIRLVGYWKRRKGLLALSVILLFGSCSKNDNNLQERQTIYAKWQCTAVSSIYTDSSGDTLDMSCMDSIGTSTFDVRNYIEFKRNDTLYRNGRYYDSLQIKNAGNFLWFGEILHMPSINGIGDYSGIMMWYVRWSGTNTNTILLERFDKVPGIGNRLITLRLQKR